MMNAQFFKVGGDFPSQGACSSGRASRWIVVVLAASVAFTAGCSRIFYRRQADAEAYCLENQKSAVAGVPANSYRIELDPRSRMFDPHSPDCEPQPPDDPLSHRYMQCVDCKRGSRLWNKLPRTAYVDNPSWQQHLPRNENGEVQLDLRGAAELALLESPNYQQSLETLYLSALDVSFERFRFDTQFFGGSEIFLTADGRDRNGTGNSSTLFTVSPLRPGNQLRAERLTATGGDLVVGVANSLVWQFAGPDDYTGTTLLDFSFIQPLLRLGGRTFVLERLTIAERALLANVRQMERYRRGFYLSVATGSFNLQGPSRRGGLFGGAGLQNFAGVGAGGFGTVGNAGNFFGFGGNNGPQQGVGGGFTGGAGAQGAGGFIGLLQTAQQIRNQRSNVASIRDSYQQLQASYDAGRIDRFQVDLARQALFNAQSQLLTSEAGYESSLDNFKTSIGLPPELEVKIEDPMLDRFNLLDPQLEAVEERLHATLDGLRGIRETIREQGAAEEDDPALTEKFERLLAECAEIEDAAGERISAVAADLAAVDASLPRRREYLTRLAGRPEVQSAQVDPQLFAPAELDRRVAARREEFNSLRAEIDKLWARMDELERSDRVAMTELLPPLVEVMSDLSSRLLELSLIQAGARLEAIGIEPVDLTGEEALLIASAYREDWQNARAQLVDSWRLIFFNAKNLQSDLNLLFSGDISNRGQNPFDIRETTGRLRLGVQWDAPLTRLAERNIYRQSLIEYQQARRSYYQFRDRIAQTLRSELRQMRLNEINFELRRAAVLIAISQVDLTQLRLSQPPQPSAAPAAPGTLAPTSPQQFNNTTARDLVQSLSDLLNVQNDFLSVWVNYEVQRMSLEYDLGVMELDAFGIRVEQKTPLADYLAGAEEIRRKLCSASDLYPGVGEVLRAADGLTREGEDGEAVEGLPLELGPLDDLKPNAGEVEGTPPRDSLPAPLINPAAEVEPPQVRPLPPVDGRSPAGIERLAETKGERDVGGTPR
jgi:hypothetical protein